MESSLKLLTKVASFTPYRESFFKNTFSVKT